MIFTEYLFDHFPELPEGNLTKLRAQLVSREGLRVHAQNISLGKYLMMGRGEEASGGWARPSALADAYEALIGAMYLDSDYVTVRRIVLTEAREHLESLESDSPEANPKGRLQELLHRSPRKARKYPIVHQSGPEHESVCCENRLAGTSTSEKAAAGARRGGSGRRPGMLFIKEAWKTVSVFDADPSLDGAVIPPAGDCLGLGHLPN